MRKNFVAQERLELSHPQWITQFKCVLSANSNSGPLFYSANIQTFYRKSRNCIEIIYAFSLAVRESSDAHT